MSISLAFGFDFVIDKIKETNGSNFNNIQIWEKLFLILIFGPILETLFLNYLPILILKNFTRNNFVFLIFNSVLFSLLHNYSCFYMVFAFLSALLLNFYFIIVMITKDEMRAIKYTILLHFSYNLSIFIMSDLLKII
ncbi:CPBP family glutamic-type intramembrane protease [Flavobacterium sp. CAN_S2]|uniref:CPBP family glutamic-type intramembrane protease n=1 Tax=Flavobacterium sp. CAN_S2 TaxID=2787726 RepID=UPI0018CBD360